MHKLFYLFAVFLILGLGCNSSCCGKKNKNPENEKSAAVINGHKISHNQLEKLHDRGVEQIKITGYPIDERMNKKMRASILKKMIDDEVVRQKAESLGISISRFERVDGFERYKSRLGGEQAYKAFLKQKKLSEEQVLETVVEELTRAKLIEKMSAKVALSEEEIKKHYENNQKIYTKPEMIRARHILFKVTESDPPEKMAMIYKKAQEVLLETRQPNASFVDMVQKYSEGPSVKQDGDLGFFPRGRMVKEFEDIAFNAPLRMPIGPVKTAYGFHIIYVEEKIPERVAGLAEMRPRIEESLMRSKQSQKTESLLVDLRKAADIKIFDSSLTEGEYRGEEPKEITAKAN